MKKMFLLIAIIVAASGLQADYAENFDAFSSGVLTAQENWEANDKFDVVATSSVGEYVGGKSLQLQSTVGWGSFVTRNDATGVDLGLALDGSGIDMSFDMQASATSAMTILMYLREGRTANYSPSFGLGNPGNGGGRFVYRPAATSGDTIGTNWIGSGGLWAKGDWVRVTGRFTGANFENLTITCYNLTTGVEIPTGISGADTGVDVKSQVATCTVANFTVAVNPGCYVDNVVVKDYYAPAAPTPNVYVEDFESESLGSINQAGWRDNAAAVTVVATTDSGEYEGGAQAIKASSADEWPQYAQDRSEDFGLQVGTFDGVEMGFDFKETGESLLSCRMHVRTGITASYSPAFGLNGGAFAIRENGDAGTTYTGNAIGSAGAGFWEKGDWVRIVLTLSGDSYNYATLTAYNLTKSVKIPTGLKNVNLGTNPVSTASSWSRLVFRMSSSSGTYVDNAYITDYVNTNILAEDPNPENEAYPVDFTGDVTLGWTGVPSASSHKVYFGTEADTLTLETDTTDESYLLPYTLEAGVTYYWRVDEVIAGADNEGDLWSFTTELGDLGYPRRMAYEGFEYDEYLSLSQTPNNGGFGWDTKWERSAGTWCYLNVGQGSLSPAMDYLLGTKGNRIQHPTAAGNDAMRMLEYPIDARANQDYYISYIAMGEYDQENKVDLAVFESKNGAYLFQSHMIYQGYPGVTTPQFALRDPSGTWLDKLYGSWASNEVYVIVIKISASVSGDDTISVSVFDATNPLPIEEPAIWDQSFTTQSNKVYPWLSISGRSPDAYDMWNLDEIHVGTGWGAVTGWASACGDLGTIMGYDLNQDCTVDFGDYAVMAADWLKCTDPAIDGCEWVIDENDPNFTTQFTDLEESELNVYENDGITIDGDLSDWVATRWYNSMFTNGYQTASIADVTDVQMAVKWDPATPEVVYVAVKVTDTNQTFGEGTILWNDADNLSVRFSVNDTSLDELWFDNETFATAQYYRFYHTASGGTGSTLVHGSGQTDDPATDYIDVAYGTSVVGDEIHYEMALPTYSSFDINTQSGTKVTLADGDVVAINLQINSLNGTESGALFADQGKIPDAWPAFAVTLNSSLPLGAFGFFDADLDTNGVVGLSDLDTIIEKWLSCTDPEITGCDQPWLP